MIRFEDNIGLVHMQAKFGLKWAQGAGLSMDYEDMFQEASVAFVLASQGYNEEVGKFSTYYTRAAFSQFRKTIGVMSGVKNLNPAQRTQIAERKAENARRRAQAEPELPDWNYGLSPVMFSHIGVSDFDERNFEDSLISDERSPEEILEFKQEWEEATANLSPIAALIVEWLRDPPPELTRELVCQEAYADQAKDRGLRAPGMRDGLTIASICKFLKLVMGVPEGELALAKAELDRVVKRIEGV